jgi:hypothetical protein
MLGFADRYRIAVAGHPWHMPVDPDVSVMKPLSESVRRAPETLGPKPGIHRNHESGAFRHIRVRLWTFALVHRVVDLPF